VNESWTFEKFTQAPMEQTGTSLISTAIPQEHTMSRSSSFRQKIRAHREYRQFERALRAASPAMRTELMALSAHHTYNH
jgi:hypothetical protein